MLLILKTIKIFKKYYQSIVVMWQHMFSMPVMRTVWRRESSSRLHTVRITVGVNKIRCTIFLSMFISFLYMFRATTCPSSGEITISMRHLVFVTLCGWLVCRVTYVRFPAEERTFLFVPMSRRAPVPTQPDHYGHRSGSLPEDATARTWRW